MSTSIEQRITQMRFDNAQFEKAVQTSLGTIGKLKSSLDFKGAGKSIANLGAAAKTVSMDTLAAGVDKVTAKFGTMDVIAITALSNITNKAMNAGQRMIQSLSTDQISAGFSEYEVKIGSIQTMLANTQKYGTKLPEVTKSLEALNAYSDKTIYNFGDMTKNIGLFTNAGIRIGDATEMIQGFSNVAAASGTSSQGAASAAYQLSQALSAGKITLMDWRSLTNVGMGNKNMQEGIIQIAESMGTLKAAGLSASTVQKDFNGSLEKGWLKADVMSKYLKIMTWDSENMTAAQKKAYDAELKAIGLTPKQIASFKLQAQTAADAATKVRTFTQLIGTLRESVGSGWAKTFELIIGDFDEATTLWSGINKAIGPMITASGDARNAFLEVWKGVGGRQATIDVFANTWTSISKIFGTVGKAFEKVFPKKTVSQLIGISGAIQAFANKLIVSEKTLKNIEGVFTAFFTVIKFGLNIFKYLALGVGLALKVVKTGIDVVFGAIPGILRTAEDAINGFLSAFGLTFVGFDKAGEYILGFVNNLDQINLDALKPVISFLDDLKSKAEAFGSGIGAKISETFNFDNMRAIGQSVLDIWNSFMGVIQSTNDLAARTKDSFVNWFGGLASGIVNGAISIKNAIVNAFKTAKKYLIDFNNGVAGSMDSVTGDTVATYILSAFNLGMIVVIFKKVKAILGGGGDLMESLTGALDGLTGTFKAMQNEIKANMLIKIAAAILVLAIALTVLAQIDPNRLQSASIGIGVSIAALATGMLVLDKLSINSTGLIKTTLALILMATAITVLAKAVQVFGSMKPEELARGLGAIAITIALLVGVMGGVSNMEGSMIKASIGLVIMSGAIMALAGAVAVFGLMPINVLVQGGVALGLIMGALMLFMRAIPGDQVLAAGAGMLLLSTAIGGLVGVIMALGLLPLMILAQGMGALAVTLALLVISMNLMKTAAPGAVATMAVAVALGMLVPVILALGLIPLATLAQGIGALAVAMVIMAVGVNAMSGAVVGAAAMMAVAASMFVLALAVIMLGSAGPETVGVGLVAMAGALIIFGIAAAVLGPVIPAMLGAASAVALFGLAVLAIGVGTAVFAFGLLLLGPAAAVGAAGILLLGTTVAKLGDQIPALLGVGAAFLLLGVGLLVVAAAVMILGLGLTLVGAGLAIIAVSSALGITGLLALTAAIRGLAFDIPIMLAVGGALAVLGAGMILTGAGALIMGVGAIALAIGLLALIGVANIMLGLVDPLSGAITRLTANGPQLEAFGVSIAGLQTSMSNLSSAMSSANSSLQVASMALTMVAAGAASAAGSIQALPGAVSSSMSTVVNVMSSSSGLIAAQGLAIATTLLLLKTKFDESSKDTDTAMTNTSKAVQTGTVRIVGALLLMLSRVQITLTSAQSVLNTQSVKMGEAIINGMVRGLSDSSRVESAARRVALSALKSANSALGIESPSKEFEKTGKYSVSGIERGWLKSEDGLIGTVAGVAGNLTTVFKNSLGDLGARISGMMDADPVITPVIDLDAASKDARALNGILNSSFNVSRPKIAASLAAESVNAGRSSTETPATTSKMGDTNIEYVQNNYSPKALSRIEIYRQTNNQLSAVRGK